MSGEKAGKAADMKDASKTIHKKTKGKGRGGARPGAGNPALVKGCNNPRGADDPDGPVIAPKRQLKVYVQKCADFMEEEGWDLLHNAARVHGSRNQIPALKLSAGYGYGNPDSTVDVTSGGKSIMTVADFLANRNPDSAEGSGGD